MVRMGELATAATGGATLVSIGLGSCIGLAIVDHIAGVGVLAHVMLPTAPERMTLGGRPTYPARYADTAVRSALDAVELAGGARYRARAYIAGGSQMFDGLGSSVDFDRLQISQRNIDAVLNALVEARVALQGSDVGGSSGRMMELRLDPVEVVCRVPAEGRVVDLVRDGAA
jgi:chemotaxis protein CheD